MDYGPDIDYLTHVIGDALYNEDDTADVGYEGAGEITVDYEDRAYRILVLRLAGDDG
ncbi:hypothetical protein ACFRNT_11355 [Streptomyces sp. NPDC056697]|uniref:hypothetical protein n=1 Tax=Streptomyces sp. NPDC056697 TaxID=3345915 RepID=UPI00369CE2FE